MTPVPPADEESSGVVLAEGAGPLPKAAGKAPDLAFTRQAPYARSADARPVYGTSFPTAAHLASYAGLALTTKSSGTSIHSEHAPSGGNRQLKRAMLRDGTFYEPKNPRLA